MNAAYGQVRKCLDYAEFRKIVTRLHKTHCFLQGTILALIQGSAFRTTSI